MHEVKIPDPTLQHRKTPAWIRVARKYLTEEGKEEIRYLKKVFTVGEGEDMRILRWHEVVQRIKNYVQSHTLAEMKQMYKKITSDDYEGVDSKKGVVCAILEFYFGVDVSNRTLKQINAWMEARIKHEGRWGLGCPAGCGRFWEFRPVADFAKFRPKDDAAITGPQAEILEEFEIEVGAEYDEWGNKVKDVVMEKRYRIIHWEGDERIVKEVPINRGYLNWTQKAGSVVFKCDSCGAEIRLVK